MRDRIWDVQAKLGCRLGMYAKHTSTDGRYYYVVGPGLPFPRFCVIAESLEHERERWQKDWMSGEPAAVLWFAFWKLKLRTVSKATYAEADWYRGFVEVARHRERQR